MSSPLVNRKSLSLIKQLEDFATFVWNEEGKTPEYHATVNLLNLLNERLNNLLNEKVGE